MLFVNIKHAQQQQETLLFIKYFIVSHWSMCVYNHLNIYLRQYIQIT